MFFFIFLFWDITFSLALCITEILTFLRSCEKSLLYVVHVRNVYQMRSVLLGWNLITVIFVSYNLFYFRMKVLASFWDICWALRNLISIDLQYIISERYQVRIWAWNDCFVSLNLSQAFMVFSFWTTISQTHSVRLNIDGMLNLIF